MPIHCQRVQWHARPRQAAATAKCDRWRTPHGCRNDDTSTRLLGLGRAPGWSLWSNGLCAARACMAAILCLRGQSGSWIGAVLEAVSQCGTGLQDLRGWRPCQRIATWASPALPGLAGRTKLSSIGCSRP